MVCLLRRVHVGALVSFLCILSQASRATIAVDGLFTDWSGVEASTSGLLFETTGEVRQPTNDIAEVRQTSDDHDLYLLVTCREPIQPCNKWGFHILVDSDLNKATGFPAGPLGVDYLVQLDSALSSTLQVHQRMNGENDTTWSKWHNGVPVPEAVAVGSGTSSNQLEFRIPLTNLEIADTKTPGIRFRICENSVLMQTREGEWVPDWEKGYFSCGQDPSSMQGAKSILPNGGFDVLTFAAARPLPQDWIESAFGEWGTIEAQQVGQEGNRALHLVSGEVGVGMHSQPLPITHGLARFRYRIIASSRMGQNLALNVIAQTTAGTRMESRSSFLDSKTFVPSKEQVGDGAWHSAWLEFHFPGAEFCTISLVVNDGTPEKGLGDWLIDDVEVYVVREGPQPHLAGVWSDQPLATVGAPVVFSSWVVNEGDAPAKSVQLVLTSDRQEIPSATRTLDDIAGGDFERVDWSFVSSTPGHSVLQVTMSVPGLTGSATSTSEPYRILAIEPDSKLTRQELCTDEKGFWRILESPQTLQEGNTSPLTRIKTKKSGEIGHSLYGLCIQLPRSKDYEEPFNPKHLIDGDPETCWSSQQRPSTFPGNPPSVEIRFPKAVGIAQVNLVPYWKNSDFPLGFRVMAGAPDGACSEVLRVRNHQFRKSGLARGDKVLQEFALDSTVVTDRLRIEFDRLPLAGGNYAEVSQGYKARLSGIELLDGEGHNLALAELGASATASDCFTGWQNSAQTVNEAYKRILDLGIKWVRVGQWGDQTEWAAVERAKGEFSMDTATDAAINELAENGVDILWGLQYGNALYNAAHDGLPVKPWFDIGPIFKEGSPFHVHWGPRTEESREAFVRYVDYVVRRYKDKVRYWELWNEENGWFPLHEPELYGKLLAAVGGKIKEIDPNLTFVFGGTAAPAPITTEIALREGGALFVDAYAFHPYGIEKPEGGMGTMEFYKEENLSKTREQTGWNRVEEIIAGVKEPFAKHGRPEIDVWMNEWGTNVTGQDYTYNPGIGELGSTKYLMRFYLYSAWLGVRTAWWALYNENRSQDWGVLDPHGFGSRPLTYGLRNLCSMVSDVEPIRPCPATLECSAPDPRVISFRRDGTGETLLLVWAAELVDEKVKDYRGRITIPLAGKPKVVIVTDLYWGMSQKAEFSYENGLLKAEGVVVRDYPVLLTIGGL